MVRYEHSETSKHSKLSQCESLVWVAFAFVYHFMCLLRWYLSIPCCSWLVPGCLDSAFSMRDSCPQICMNWAKSKFEPPSCLRFSSPSFCVYKTKALSIGFRRSFLKPFVTYFGYIGTWNCPMLMQALLASEWRIDIEKELENFNNWKMPTQTQTFHQISVFFFFSQCFFRIPKVQGELVLHHLLLFTFAKKNNCQILWNIREKKSNLRNFASFEQIYFWNRVKSLSNFSNFYIFCRQNAPARHTFAGDTPIHRISCDFQNFSFGFRKLELIVLNRNRTQFWQFSTQFVDEFHTNVCLFCVLYRI